MPNLSKLNTKSFLLKSDFVFNFKS